MDIDPREIVTALKADYTLGFTEVGDFLRRGICPSCGKRELYVSTKKPFRVRCGRLNNCGYEIDTKDLLPELFTDYAKKYPPTEKNRQATADAYMVMNRGFDLSKMRGWYEQCAWAIPNTSEHVPTVRFYLDEGRTRWWERLIDKTKKDGQKANFGGRKKEDGSLFSGDAWSPPGQKLEKGDTCFIVEGIFHAIALHHAGYKAIAAFSCSHFPATFINENAKKQVRWIVALDSDKAGKDAAKKHHARLKQMGELASVCMLPPSKDWDDLWRENKIDKKFIAERLYYGRLFLAASVQEKAYITYTKKRRSSFLLEFEHALYNIVLNKDFDKELENASIKWAEGEEQAKLAEKAGDDETPGTNEEAKTEARSEVKDDKKNQKAEKKDEKPSYFELENAREAVLQSTEGRDIFYRYCNISQVSNIVPTFLYIERDTMLDEQKYVFKIEYANGKSFDIVPLEGTAITSPDAFRKAMLQKTQGGTFKGDMKTLDILCDRWLNGSILTVSSNSYIGYDNESKAYIFQNHAWHNGRCIERNKNGYFTIGKRGIKSSLKGVNISTDGKFSPDWLQNFAKAFCWQGLATLAFWLGSLFAQQIRAKHKTFPFLELTGEPGAGKSTILEFLWKCTGRDDYEGFDLLKSTQAGRRRAFSQVSNLPVVLIESDRDNGDKDAKQKQFGFDEVKPFYNGRATGTLGVATRSNDVDEALFQASLIISQNAEVDGSEALLQRIVHCHADKKHHEPGTREIARWFERQTSNDVGGFLGAALSHEREVLAAYEEAFVTIEAEYSASALQNERIIKNHAQIAACGEALSVIFPKMSDYLKKGLREYLLIRAKTREQRLAADHPMVEAFWDLYDYLQEGRYTDKWTMVNHHGTEGYIAVNFNHMREVAQKSGQIMPDIALLKKLLPRSSKRKFVEANKAVRSQCLGKTIKCWVFKEF